MFEPHAYPLWHGTSPMGPYLRDKAGPERLLVASDGVRVQDSSGKWFLDGRSGLWNVGLGYSCQPVIEAIQEQLRQLPFGTLLSYDRPPAVTLEYARRLQLLFPETPWVRLGNSGSQMTETALLAARLFHRLQGSPRRRKIVAFQGSYHGMGTTASTFSGIVASLSGEPADEVVLLAAEGDWSDAFTEHVKAFGAEDLAAVIVEPMMGSLGVIPTDDGLRRLANLCSDHGVLFIADEVTTGFGRTGAMSRCLSLGIRPDMIVLGKTMTSAYVPIGALLVSDAIYQAAYDPATPAILAAGTTTDGHPLAAAAGLAVLDEFDRRGIIANVVSNGPGLQARLQRAVHDAVPDGLVDGAGYMQRVALRHPTGKAWAPAETEALRLRCEDEGLLISRGVGCIWIVPPLVSDEAVLQEIGDRLASALLSLISDGLVASA